MSFEVKIDCACDGCRKDLDEGAEIYCDTCLEGETDKVTEAEAKYNDLLREFEGVQQQLAEAKQEHERQTVKTHEVLQELHDLKTGVGIP